MRPKVAWRPPLGVEVVAVLLAGLDADPPPSSPRGATPDWAILDTYTPEGCAKLWTLHESWLRSMATAWGWEPSYELADGTRVFYAQWRAAGHRDLRWMPAAGKGQRS
jgi:hypothetical protein